MTTSKWILPFKGRNNSGAFGINFVCKSNGVYFMDNHRAASWCWEQEIGEGRQIELLHIDAHYDAGMVKDEDVSRLPRPAEAELGEYLGVVQSKPLVPNAPVVLWDNYLSIFEQSHRDQIKYFGCLTHRIGSPPSEKSGYRNVACDEAIAMIHSAASSDQFFILNIDLDYFSTHSSPVPDPELHLIPIAKATGGLTKNPFVCITVCLSPECCGGWQNAEYLLSKFCNAAELDFELPGA
ncbi:UPF0489 family protein [Halomonadaceae bacterium KBTZ08]